MKNVTLFFALICLSFCLLPTYGKSRIASVPFKVVGSYMIVEVRINGSTKMNMILDSGASATLITELTEEDSLSLNYNSLIEIKGLGTGSGVMANRSQFNELRAGKIKLTNQTVYVLKENIFNLSNHVGYKINGILGADFFQNHIVRINYNTQVITLYDSKTFEVPKGYEPISMSIERNRMYITLPVTGSNWKVHQATLLLDTGAEVTAWFRSFGENHIEIPKKNIDRYIGQGLNVVIEGHLGRINQISMKGHILNAPVVAFPDSLSIAEVISISERDGIIGGQLLNRFNLIFDYPKRTLWIKPNSNFKKPFTYNIAGLDLSIENKFLALPEVCNVSKNSPAERADIRVGDQIFKINELNALQTTINDIRLQFMSISKKPIKLILLRGNATIYTEVEMSDQLK